MNSRQAKNTQYMQQYNLHIFKIYLCKKDFTTSLKQKYIWMTNWHSGPMTTQGGLFSLVCVCACMCDQGNMWSCSHLL